MRFLLFFFLNQPVFPLHKSTRLRAHYQLNIIKVVFYSPVTCHCLSTGKSRFHVNTETQSKRSTEQQFALSLQKAGAGCYCARLRGARAKGSAFPHRVARPLRGRCSAGWPARRVHPVPAVPGDLPAQPGRGDGGAGRAGAGGAGGTGARGLARSGDVGRQSSSSARLRLPSCKPPARAAVAASAL